MRFNQPTPEPHGLAQLGKVLLRQSNDVSIQILGPLIEFKITGTFCGDELTPNELDRMSRQLHELMLEKRRENANHIREDWRGEE